MSGRRLPMRRICEILRWRWVLKRSHRDVSRGLEVSIGQVSEMVNRAVALGLTTMEAIEAQTDQALKASFYGPQQSSSTRPLPDFVGIHEEIQRTSVALQFLYAEYLQENPPGLSYSRFCEIYRG